MELFSIYIIAIAILAYIVGFAAIIDNDTTVYNWNGRRASSYNRKIISKDVWMAVIWPLRFILVMLKTTLEILHNILSIFLLLFFIPYKYSKTYTKINTYLNK